MLIFSTPAAAAAGCPDVGTFCKINVMPFLLINMDVSVPNCFLLVFLPRDFEPVVLGHFFIKSLVRLNRNNKSIMISKALSTAKIKKSIDHHGKVQIRLKMGRKIKRRKKELFLDYGFTKCRVFFFPRRLLLVLVIPVSKKVISSSVPTRIPDIALAARLRRHEISNVLVFSTSSFTLTHKKPVSSQK